MFRQDGSHPLVHLSAQPCIYCALGLSGGAPIPRGLGGPGDYHPLSSAHVRIRGDRHPPYSLPHSYVPAGGWALQATPGWPAESSQATPGWPAENRHTASSGPDAALPGPELLPPTAVAIDAAARLEARVVETAARLDARVVEIGDSPDTAAQ